MHKKLQHGIDTAPAIYYRGALPLRTGIGITGITGGQDGRRIVSR